METMYNDLSFPTFSVLKSLFVDDCQCVMFVLNFSGSLKVPMENAYSCDCIFA